YDPRHAYLPDHLCAVGPTHPVTFVSWVDAQEFAERMTLKDRYHYRLPTEAEWEYACRGVAGNATNIGQIMQIEFVDYTLE
ncbi:SUMF1/EgtB/PvdO family nonheme iron enzyme, partial [Acinetobacter baumannii]